MKKSFKPKTLIAVLFLSCCFFAFKPFTTQVQGWFLAGSHPDAYKIGTLQSAERKSEVAYLKSTKKVNGFGTIMQEFIPEDYLGKRVRLTGYIRSENVKHWAGMWFRVDDHAGKVLNFDNMQERPITGTTDWKKYEIVLDVPPNSAVIAYGVLLAGQGSVWLDDMKFEVVTKDVSATKHIPIGKKPENTDFESSSH